MLALKVSRCNPSRIVGLLEQQPLGLVAPLSPVLLASARRRTAGWRAGHLLPQSFVDRSAISVSGVVTAAPADSASARQNLFARRATPRIAALKIPDEVPSPINGTWIAFPGAKVWFGSLGPSIAGFFASLALIVSHCLVQVTARGDVSELKGIRRGTAISGVCSRSIGYRFGFSLGFS